MNIQYLKNNFSPIQIKKMFEIFTVGQVVLDILDKSKTL